MTVPMQALAAEEAKRMMRLRGTRITKLAHVIHTTTLAEMPVAKSPHVQLVCLRVASRDRSGSAKTQLR